MKKAIYKLQSWFQKLLEFLCVGPFVVGLEVTDQVVRLAHFDGATWQLSAVRLAPGTFENGRLKDRAAFIATLGALRANILPKEPKNKKIDTMLALGETIVYSQVFGLPMVADEELAKAVQLNVQMASPVDISQMYSGWQVVGRDTQSSRIDVLAVFADRAVVDELSWALFDAGFVSRVVESKALALARMVRKRGAGIDPNGSYLVVNIDDAGLNFLVLRHGQLYFEYADRWHDLADDKGAVPFEKFQETLTLSLRQVTNFYLQHWTEPMAGVLLSAAAFKEEAEDIIKKVVMVPVVPFMTSDEQQLSPEWFVAGGAGLNTLRSRSKDHGVTLLGAGAREAFEKDRIVRFASVWRFITPVFFAILLGIFGMAYFFLLGVQTNTASFSANAVSPEETQTVADLVASSTAFNQSVALIQSIENSAVPKYPTVQEVVQFASANAIVLTHLVFADPDTTLLLSGQAQSQSQIIAFKTALETASSVISVDLPITGIENSGSEYSFLMTVSLEAPSSTPLVE